MPGRKTLGELSIGELIEGVDQEYVGFTEWLEREFQPTEEQARWMRAFSGSIRGRLAMATFKVEDQRKLLGYLEATDAYVKADMLAAVLLDAHGYEPELKRAKEGGQ